MPKVRFLPLTVSSKTSHAPISIDGDLRVVALGVRAPQRLPVAAVGAEVAGVAGAAVDDVRSVIPQPSTVSSLVVRYRSRPFGLLSSRVMPCESPKNPTRTGGWNGGCAGAVEVDGEADALAP